jgi:hypothetical protein
LNTDDLLPNPELWAHLRWIRLKKPHNLSHGYMQQEQTKKRPKRKKVYGRLENPVY